MCEFVWGTGTQQCDLRHGAHHGMRLWLANPTAHNVSGCVGRHCYGVTGIKASVMT
jgi:hypothetical protein